MIKQATYPPGMIGLPASDLSRYSDFIPSIVALQKPPGTQFKLSTGLGVANPLNDIAAAFLKNPILQWLFLTNDDNLCPPDTILRLLDRNVDIISGLYFGRIMPFEPIAFDSVALEPRGRGGEMVKWFSRHLMLGGESGLHEMEAVGDGCLLIRRRVLESFSFPIWEYGATLSDACDHDMVFSQKVLDAGFKLYCDFDVKVDHVANFVVRPHRTPEGEWQVLLVQGDGRSIVLPAAHK